MNTKSETEEIVEALKKIDNFLFASVFTIVGFIIGVIIGVNYNKGNTIPPVGEIVKVDSITKVNDSIKIKIESLDSVKNAKIIEVQSLDNDSTIKLFYKLISK